MTCGREGADGVGGSHAHWGNQEAPRGCISPARPRPWVCGPSRKPGSRGACWPAWPPLSELQAHFQMLACCRSLLLRPRPLPARVSTSNVHHGPDGRPQCQAPWRPRNAVEDKTGQARAGRRTACSPSPGCPQSPFCRRLGSFPRTLGRVCRPQPWAGPRSIGGKWLRVRG